MMSAKISRSLGPESAKPGRLADGKLVNEEQYFSEWFFVEDDWARGGGYHARQGYVDLDSATPYQWCEHVDGGEPVWSAYFGIIELIQIKSNAVEGYCTILGDLSRAVRVESPSLLISDDDLESQF